MLARLTDFSSRKETIQSQACPVRQAFFICPPPWEGMGCVVGSWEFPQGH